MAGDWPLPSDAAPTEVTFVPLDDPGGFPPDTPLTELGIYCVGTRPIPADGGDATLVQVRVATQPELLTSTREFIPPVERSPIDDQIVLDLEIPVPDRRTDVIQKIESLIEKYLTGEAFPVPVYKLPTINLAENASSKCAQVNERLVQTTDLAQAAKELVTTLPGVHQQIHLLYFNNLDAPLPTQLTTSLETLLVAMGRSPPNYEVDLYSWLFGPPGSALPMDAVNWWAFWIWETSDEAFEMNLDKYPTPACPGPPSFTIQATLSSSSRPTRPPHSKASSSRSASPAMGHSRSHSCRTRTPSTSRTGRSSSADPPSYPVQLKYLRVVMASDFVQQSSIVRYRDLHPLLRRARVRDRGQPRQGLLVRELRLRGAGLLMRTPFAIAIGLALAGAPAGRVAVAADTDPQTMPAPVATASPTPAATGSAVAKAPLATVSTETAPAQTRSAAATPAAETTPAPAARPVPVVKPTVAKSQPRAIRKRNEQAMHCLGL